MECPKCKAPNDKLKRFCTKCGTPLGVLCDRCGSVNGNDDKYCGMCGLPLLNSGSESVERSPESQNIPRQYDTSEILSLLSLRMAMENESKAAQTYSQKDIDQLFE